MAYVKRTDGSVKKTQEKKVTMQVEEHIEKKEKTIHQFSGDDLIPCRSMTRGELIYVGNKSGEVYKWSDFGDVTEVEYQDLLGLRARKSDFIYNTMFVILDEDVLEDPKWADVKSIYDKIYSDDIETLINMPLDKFKSVFPSQPEGVKNSVVVEVGTQMENGTFDSIQKIKFIDEICKTDLSSML